MDVGRRAAASSSWQRLVSLVSLVSLVMPLASGHQGEAFFNGTSSLAIGNSSSTASTASTYHLGFSFRACGPTEGGFLLTQVANGDQLHVELLPHNEEGKLKVSISVCDKNFSVETGLRLDDNRWHDIDLRFVNGLLQVQLDDERATIANSSDFVNSPLFKRSEEVDAPIVLGQGYKGCLLEGPSVQFTTMNDDFLNNCPIPLMANFTVEGDPCWIQPCQNNGVCMVTDEGFQCVCTLRFGGDRCQYDMGSLCQRTEHSCLNGGTCRENFSGNGTVCACPDTFTGKVCENTIDLKKCPVNTCANGATCYAESGRNLCVCPAGFDGPRCEIDIDDCDPSPCKNDGLCVDGADTFTCNCNATGFEGDRCETKVDQCLSNPCQNGGTCFDRYNKYVCQCLAGFSGINCHLQISSRMLKELECAGDTCLNGGVCSVSGGDIECLCQNGFTGARCGDVDNKCLNVTCPQNAICVEGIDSHRCICQPGFSGSPPDCVEVNECDSSPCANSGSCKDRVNGYECLCQPGFGGSDCETDVDECASAPCLNGGLCVDSVGSHTCNCPAGFNGDRCQIDVDECADNPCVHAVGCNNLAGKYECECEPGWKGANCDEDIDECQPSPCMNNATCINQLNAFLCQCPDGLTGKRCETNRDDCTPDPCKNNSTCVDQVGNYTCVCPPQFMGRHCQDVFDACATSPCQNGASCITTQPQQDFYCECVAGYEGLHCENNIDECFSVQCSEGKQCVDLIAGYECRCPPGFAGALCLDNIDDCKDLPCQNGGSCIDGVANYTCSCPKGFTGRDCQDDVDECQVLEPCVYGICQNTVGSYQCYCRPGFSGDNCNLEFDECLSHPCNNNGTCNNLINGYECVCAAGFSGKDCDVNINECESSPCQNNATCIDAIAAFTCICPPGFNGDRCHINIDECQSGPCQNEGLCVDGVNSYGCDCSDTGFKGDHCEINVDDCESAPCTHGSQCVDLVKDYKCTCFPGYDGKNCQNDINECDAIPCQNGATCLERSNRTLYDLSVFSDFSYNTSGGYVCRCLPGFEGDDCQVNIDECALSSTRPCKFGECIDGVNNYTCRCDPGYEGDDCHVEIDECERLAPCVNGKCVDLVADYQCDCTDNFGGKNCSVELLGCIDVTCLHGGTCLPFLADETEHKFTCQCPFGYHGELCQHATTMSFNGSSFMAVQTNRDEGYDLSLRFRTTLPNGLLAVGQGQTFYRLELSNGQLNLHSSLLNKWEGVFLGSNLNDAQWQTIRVRFNLTHLHLVVNQQEALYPINPVESVNSTETSFGMTVLGGATSFLRILAQGVPFFVGCIENVVVNDNWVIPSASPVTAAASATGSSDSIIRLSGVAVEVGCPRQDHCKPNPCQNDGVCNDMWTFFNCSCQRPYLGDNCQLSYTAATFGHENSTSSLVSVSITPQERLALSNSMDVSLFVRTREPTGLIFYLGTPPPPSGGSPDANKWASYIAAELRDGQLLVVAELGDNEEIFTVDSVPLNDGNSHLIQVIRDRLELQVKINGTDYLNDTLRSFRPLQAEVLFLGGLPPSALPSSGLPDSAGGRSRRQTTSSTLSSRLAAGASKVLDGRHFKGVLQDIQIKSGNITRVVQVFPLAVPREDIPESLGTIESNDVLEGTVSDDACVGDPCVKGNCTVTWNDYKCICPAGFKGKNCSEMEFCAIHDCPSGGICQNLNDGYECLSSATFNGVNNTIDYASVGIDPAAASASASGMHNISFSFRTKVGGTVLSVDNAAAAGIRAIRLDIVKQGVVVRWIDASGSSENLVAVPEALDGQWHQIQLNISSIIDNFSLSQMVAGGAVTLGGSAESSIVKRQAPEAADIPELTTISSDADSGDDVPPAILPPWQHFRGCLNEFRIGELLLPFFEADALSSDPSPRKFQVTSGLRGVELGCRLCYDAECRNDAVCLDPAVNYTCNCLAGYQGDQCQVNIDECVDNLCDKGTCVDGVANYTCACDLGWTSWLCDEEINECEANPCQNEATCTDLIGTYLCNCTEDYTGNDCEKLKVVTCANSPCSQGDCSDLYDPVTQLANNFTCLCPFGYQGLTCDQEIDYCVSLAPCQNGAICTGFPFEPGYICECAEGFSGDYCELDINECSQRPCLNGGRCIDGVNNFTCNCDTTGFEGYLCEVDIDECRHNDPCVSGRCVNSAGSYNCICDNDDDCGKHCDRKDPCKNDSVCFNGASCIAYCDELDAVTNTPVYTCSCLEGFEGRNCSTEILAAMEPNMRLVVIIVPVVMAILLIILIATVIFVMMARNKRATRGTYSPSRQEMFSPRVEMGQVMKPPPEERLI